MKITSFINNQETITDSFFNKLNPFTNENFHQVFECSVLNLVHAIRDANKAHQEWQKSSFVERKKLIEKIKASIIQHQDEFARLEAQDQGLPVSFIKRYSIDKIIDEINKVINEEIQIDDNQNVNSAYSVGVIAIISSWNLSLRIVLSSLFPALLAGNAVIVKISSASPVTAEILKRIILESSVPSGLIQVIVSNSTEIKNLLITHPGVHAIRFTGSLNNSVQVIKQAAGVSENSFKKLQIGSGSKNISGCLEAPTAQNIQAVLNSFLIGQGQLAWNSSRLFVLEKYEKEWITAIEDFFQKLKPSEGIEDESSWGPCIKEKSVDFFSGLLKQAKNDQAKLIQADYKPNEKQARYLLPTFTRDMSKCSELQQQQIFSPFFILNTVKYPFDIAKNANLSYYGYAAHLYGGKNKLTKIADDLEVGAVTFNDWSIGLGSAIEGVKQSGFGIQDTRFFGAFYSNVKKLN